MAPTAGPLDLIYFNLPPGSSVETSKVSLHGTGLITIPWGCSLTHGLTTFFNLNSATSFDIQRVLYISAESLTPRKAWKAPLDLKLTSLTTLVSLICSLLVTQCTNICLYLGFCKKHSNTCCANPTNTKLTTQAFQYLKFADPSSFCHHTKFQSTHFFTIFCL